MRIVLVDCENLTGTRQRNMAFRWRGFDRAELFGRSSLLPPWHAALEAEGIPVAAAWPVADDAPPQVADALIVARAEALAAQSPALLAIASNDADFVAPVAGLARRGFPVVQHRDPGPAELLRLVAEALARDGRVDAAAIGTVMAERFGIRLAGRMDALAGKAGLTVERHRHGIRLVLRSCPDLCN